MKSLKRLLLFPLTTLGSMSTCCALDQPRSISLDLAGMTQNAVTLQQHLAFFQMEMPQSNCSVCDNDGIQVSDRAIQRILSRTSRLIQRTSTFANFKRTVLRTRVGRRRYDKSVSSNTIVPILNATASQFAALAGRLQERSATQTPGPPTSFIESAMLDLLQEVATVSSRVAYDIAAVLENTDTTTAGLVTTSILLVLAFFERIVLASTVLVADQLRSLNGEQQLNVTTSTLRAPTNATDGVFHDVLIFLSVRGDTSGLVPVLTKLTTELPRIEARWEQLQSDVNDSAINVKASSAVAAPVGNKSHRNDSRMQVAALALAMTTTVVNNVQRIASESLNGGGIGGLLVHTVGLFVKSVDTILNQSLVTINTVFGLFRSYAKDHTPALVSGDTVIFNILCQVVTGGNPICLDFAAAIFLTIAVLLSPLLLPFLIIGYVLSSVFDVLGSILGGGGGGNRRGDAAAKLLRCRREALACQNQALLAALPSA